MCGLNKCCQRKLRERERERGWPHQRWGTSGFQGRRVLIGGSWAYRGCESSRWQCGPSWRARGPALSRALCSPRLSARSATSLLPLRSSRYTTLSYTHTHSLSLSFALWARGKENSRRWWSILNLSCASGGGYIYASFCFIRGGTRGKPVTIVPIL